MEFFALKIDLFCAGIWTPAATDSHIDTLELTSDYRQLLILIKETIKLLSESKIVGKNVVRGGGEETRAGTGHPQGGPGHGYHPPGPGDQW